MNTAAANFPKGLNAQDRKSIHMISRMAVGHCSAELVNKKMPMLVCDDLYNYSRSCDEDIKTYVSACAGASWTYDKYPAWATDTKVWDDSIIEEQDGLFHIDLKKVILSN